MRGKVFDAVTGETLPYVNISFKGTKIGTTSDIDGNFEISTYYATDSLTASFVGFLPTTKAVVKDQEQTIDFPMRAGINLKEVEIKADKDAENPAHPIIRKVIANKAINDREKLQSYSYEVYNKVEFDLNNVTEAFTKRRALRPFNFIFDYIDSTEEKNYLPIFLSETISQLYYRKNPKAQKENIEAVKVSGIENESVTQFLGDMYQNVNVYDNNISVFGKPFKSPISDNGFFFYKYYLVDSLWKDNYWCYHIKFIPKRENDPVYSGELFIHDTTYAIKEFQGNIAKEANINFIEGFSIHQEFEQVEPEVWMLTKDQLVVDFTLTEKSMGLYGRKTSTYRDHKINEELPDDFYNAINPVTVADDAKDKTDAYWNTNRHDTLGANEKAIYTMVDSLKEVPRFQTYLDILNIVFTGYKVIGNIEIGPYSSIYSFNPVEGNRVKLGMRTSNKFSTNVALSGFAAYGFRDRVVKYGGSFFAFTSKQPRSFFELSYSKDMEQLGASQNTFQVDGTFSSFLRRNPADKLTFVTEYSGYYEHEWFYGFSNRLIFRTRQMEPRGSLDYEALGPNGGLINRDRIRTTEVGFYTRFAYKERFVSGEFDRVSLGTDYPILEVQYTQSLPGVLEADYNYQKLYATITDDISLGYIGYTETRIEAGKIWGRAPYPLLEIHNGNETFFYDDNAFNTMNFFEFVSDQFVSVSATHHFEGLFFNRVPLLKKLKWREVVSGKAVYGTYNPQNSETLVLSDGINTFRDGRPFMEAAVGIENILKFLRVDALWRLSYLDNPNIVKFGIRAKLQLKF